MKKQEPNNISFENLMEESGVKPLTPSSGDSPSMTSFKIADPPQTKTPMPKYSHRPPLKKKGKKSHHQNQKIKLPRKFNPEQKIDLHRKTRTEAIDILETLFKNSKSIKNVLIITGKGEGVLKNATWNWLKKKQETQSFYFQLAPAYLGGDGAILVFL